MGWYGFSWIMELNIHLPLLLRFIPVVAVWEVGITEAARGVTMGAEAGENHLFSTPCGMGSLVTWRRC